MICNSKEKVDHPSISKIFSLLLRRAKYDTEPTEEASVSVRSLGISDSTKLQKQNVKALTHCAAGKATK